MESTKKLLDHLLREKVISGYNYFPMCSNFAKGRFALVLSNFHESKEYLFDIIHDLESGKYLTLNTSLEIRSKSSYTRWKSNFRVVDDNNNFFKELRLRDEKGYIHLETIGTKQLEDLFTEEYIENLVGEDEGYEIAIESNRKDEIIRTTELFFEKSSQFNLGCWKDAYKVPVIILEGRIEVFKSYLTGFNPAKICKKRIKDHEYNFVFKNFKREREEELIRKGFKINPCLVNNLFFEIL